MKRYSYIFKISLVLILVIFYLSLDQSFASEFRMIRPIPTPKAPPEGAVPVKKIRPVAREVVEGAVRELIQAWNNKNLEGVVGDEFYDKSRLSDAMDKKVPRDAELRILSIQGIQTLNRYTEIDPSGDRWIVSTVSATVRTQLEFNDPDSGFQRREGTNEYIFMVKEKLE